MKTKFETILDVKIYTIDAVEALPYNFRSSTNVIFDNEHVHVDIATDAQKMHAFLSSRL
ncbi:MAG TPA: hypothetical protein PK842_06680 [Smithella sp.]|jgi:hypothetical protein|nr:hypothetical protein [Smithella sp.]OQC52503.1 MAG: hypothetical protein BWX55_01586 [Deltaproteobacteria bacterium ADurb.Bin022]HOQ41565.1 hypothetical protein [Smithellaceae bacterium]HOE32478.1 hypothetical protein [Smithella sp.]HOG10482.1 hypothetical protein [Smithella sp.]